MMTRLQLSTGRPHALTGGPCVQVQFTHLKISTLTTVSAYKSSNISDIKILRGKIGLRLLLRSNRKFYTRFRLVPKPTTSDEL